MIQSQMDRDIPGTDVGPRAGQARYNPMGPGSVQWDREVGTRGELLSWKKRKVIVGGVGTRRETTEFEEPGGFWVKAGQGRAPGPQSFSYSPSPRRRCRVQEAQCGGQMGKFWLSHLCSEVFLSTNHL